MNVVVRKVDDKICAILSVLTNRKKVLQASVAVLWKVNTGGSPKFVTVNTKMGPEGKIEMTCSCQDNARRDCEHLYVFKEIVGMMNPISNIVSNPLQHTDYFGSYVAEDVACENQKDLTVEIASVSQNFEQT